MGALPTGTVTFLFTDVEGSTRSWEAHPHAMPQALARHDALIEEAVEQHGGTVVRPRGEGDSRFAVFARATDAVAAAVAIQRVDLAVAIRPDRRRDLARGRGHRCLTEASGHCGRAWAGAAIALSRLANATIPALARGINQRPRMETLDRLATALALAQPDRVGLVAAARRLASAAPSTAAAPPAGPAGAFPTTTPEQHDRHSGADTLLRHGDCRVAQGGRVIRTVRLPRWPAPVEGRPRCRPRGDDP
jgi:class 3 adenylate cyclase